MISDGGGTKGMGTVSFASAAYVLQGKNEVLAWAAHGEIPQPSVLSRYSPILMIRSACFKLFFAEILAFYSWIGWPRLTFRFQPWRTYRHVAEVLFEPRLTLTSPVKTWTHAVTGGTSQYFVIPVTKKTHEQRAGSVTISANPLWRLKRVKCRSEVSYNRFKWPLLKVIERSVYVAQSWLRTPKAYLTHPSSKFVLCLSHRCDISFFVCAVVHWCFQSRV